MNNASEGFQIEKKMGLQIIPRIIPESYPIHTSNLPILILGTFATSEINFFRHFFLSWQAISCNEPHLAMPPSTSEKNREKHWSNKLKVALAEVRNKLGSDGLVSCVARALSEEERANFQSPATLERFASSLVERSKGVDAAEEIVVQAAQEHIGSWRKSRKLLPVPGQKLWHRVRKHMPKHAPGRKTKVHSKDIRMQVRVYLLENATTSAKLMKCDGSIEPVYNLNMSKRKLWHRSVAMQSLLSRPAWYKHMAAHHKNFVRLKTRTDVCCFCHKYDKGLLPALRKDLDAVRGGVQSVQNDYFAAMDSHWEAMKAAGRTDPDDQLSLQYVKFMKLFMDKTSSVRYRTAAAPGTVRGRQDLKEAEASGATTLRKYIDILECCAHHFAGVRRQHERREQRENNLPPNLLVVQLDYMENMTWPLGPEEAQDWFWATSRESMTTLGFYVSFWRNGCRHREYWHYISQVMNHDSAFAVACLQLAATDGRKFYHTIHFVAANLFALASIKSCWFQTTGVFCFPQVHK